MYAHASRPYWVTNMAATHAQTWDQRDTLTTTCLEEEKQFRGTFQENLIKLKHLSFPEADKWIDRLGLNKKRTQEVPSLPVLATAASSGFFDVSQGLLKSVHEKFLPKYPGLKLIFYDLGLSNDQRKKVIISIKYTIECLQDHIFVSPVEHGSYIGIMSPAVSLSWWLVSSAHY